MMYRETESERATQHEADAEIEQAPDLEAEHDPEVSRRASLAGLRREVQKRASAGAATEAVHDAAARGVASPTTALPHAAAIQASFGPAHDVSAVKAHVGGNAASAMGATAFASGDHVVFDEQPDLHTAAHEAAHVVQQAHGVNLYGGVGEAGDSYERHADAVADRVVAGTSAADLLGAPTTSRAPASGAVQMDRKKVSDASAEEQSAQHTKANTYSLDAVVKSLKMGAVRIHNASTGIWNTISKMTEGGPGLQFQACKQYFASVNTELRRLRGEVQLQASFAGGTLAPEIRRLNGAFDRFKSTWEKAQQHLTKHGENLDDNPEWIKGELVALNEAGKVDYKDSTNHDPSVDERKDEVIFKEAVDANAEAAEVTARSVRMGLKTGKDTVLREDLGKLVRHIEDLAAQFRNADGRQVSTKSYDKKLLTRAMKEVHALEKEVAANPALVDFLAKTGFAYSLKTITERTGVK